MKKYDSKCSVEYDKEYNLEASISHGNHSHKETGGYLYCNCHSLVRAVNPHVHSFYEFIYITEGTCIYNINGIESVTSPGDLIFTCPNDVHSFTFPQATVFTRQFLRVYTDYENDFPKIMAQLREHSANHKNHIPAYLVEQYELDKYFDDLNHYSNIAQPETFIIAHSCVAGLIAKIDYLLNNISNEDLTLSDNKYINNILEYVAMHFSQTISLEDIAKEIHMSSVYLSKLFKDKMGMTLKSYINMYRIVHAKNLILRGEKISSLYEKCGFENYSTFYRAFIKYVGMSPEEFRNDSSPSPIYIV